jgi:hypothetical protein
MKHTRHTPGPWIAVGFWVEHPSDKRPDICNCDPRSMDQEGRSDAEILANARLIAAAPDLLEALRGALEHWPVPSSICKDRPAWEAARAAIAKATGEQP